ncbi:hypothetical protein GGQ64_005060 [Rhizobium azooxidifex]|uniref:Uncharacterized protein n=1 Tax=Mycoplana azooxidifex TaxID=1636188 RepID=A0A7W6DFT7_9HYPH|nr:hypothetical protein [Mycoplana azooxidifex]
MKRICLLGLPATLTGVLSAACAAVAQDADELAKQLSNPIASLISVPMQSNFEWGAGAAATASPTPCTSSLPGQTLMGIRAFLRITGRRHECT